jgi:transcriptional regulator with XRE-family HTH domain
MTTISGIIGQRIREIRKSKHLSLQTLADLIGKSKSTVGKYEQGYLYIDVDTLYEIATALCVPVSLLLAPQHFNNVNKHETINLPEFYRKKKLYAYFWDGRIKRVNSSLLVIGSQIPEHPDKLNAHLYMNIKDYNKPYQCENTYFGTIEFHHILVSIILQHRDTPIEHAMINILENFNQNAPKFGMWCGISFRPFEPVSLKMLFSEEPLAINDELTGKLLINKENIKKLRINNYYAVTQNG